MIGSSNTAKAETHTPNTFPFPQAPRTTRLRDWPFYLDRKQRALLRWIRDTWGEDCTIQIAGGRVRIATEGGILDVSIGELSRASDRKSGVPERIVTRSSTKSESR
jgi:hypothetical protein